MTTSLAPNRDGCFPAGSLSATLTDSFRPGVCLTVCASPTCQHVVTADLTWVLQVRAAFSRKRSDSTAPRGPRAAPHLHTHTHVSNYILRLKITVGRAGTHFHFPDGNDMINMWGNTPEGFWDLLSG